MVEVKSWNVQIASFVTQTAENTEHVFFFRSKDKLLTLEGPYETNLRPNLVCSLRAPNVIANWSETTQAVLSSDTIYYSFAYMRSHFQGNDVYWTTVAKWITPRLFTPRQTNSLKVIKLQGMYQYHINHTVRLIVMMLGKCCHLVVCISWVMNEILRSAPILDIHIRTCKWVCFFCC